MNTARSLFDPEPPARRGEPTQAEAASFIRDRAPTLREKVLTYIRSRTQIQAMGGATIEEIAAGLDMKQSTVCGRVDELRKLGRIEDSGVKRPTLAGVSAKVWRSL